MKITIDDIEVELTDIVRIDAYKVDLLTFDEIRFDISLNDTIISISEEHPNFNYIDNVFSQNMVGYESNWRKKVTFPAFAENRLTVYNLDF